jgi:8-oxo-dGTP pyrophosphatase MutT (NUDIX family)
VPHPLSAGRRPTQPAEPLEPPAAADLLPRRAARVLLIDHTGRVLLFRGWDPARPSHRYWFTPGGGLDPDESTVRGAARELAEETGLRVRPEDLGEPVWSEVTTFPFDGRWYRQEQEFFLLVVPEWRVDTAGFDHVERGSIDEHRWWSLADLEATDERVYPDDLAGLLRRVLADQEAGTC